MANRIFKALSLAVMLSASAGISAQTRYTVLPSSPEQHIQHFGASDAWSMQFIGLWPEQQQRQVADWLFSSENDEQGKPKGIGLSIWRFNLGAGSAEQGDKAEINSATRTECFLRADGTYDWTKQEGQRRFLKLAKERGVPYMLAFCNSAPVYFTKNGLATNTGRGGTINLKDDCYDDFARFMATSVKGIEEHDGVHIDYISPCNEPDGHWNWLGPKQEGSPATNREVAHVARELGKALSKQKLNTEILVNESSDYRCMLGTHVADWQRGNEIKALFSKDSTQTYVGNVKHMMPLIGGHSYWTNTPIDYMRECRMQVREACKKQNIKFWQTEICIMGNDEEIGGGGGYDFSMKTALYVARDIRTVSEDGKEITEGFNDPKGVMCSAYRNSDGKWAIVAINYSEDVKPVCFNVEGVSAKTWRMYRTSDVSAESLAPIGTTDGTTNLAPRSVTTLVEE